MKQEWSRERSLWLILYTDEVDTEPRSLVNEITSRALSENSTNKAQHELPFSSTISVFCAYPRLFTVLEDSFHSLSCLGHFTIRAHSNSSFQFLPNLVHLRVMQRHIRRPLMSLPAWCAHRNSNDTGPRLHIHINRKNKMCMHAHLISLPSQPSERFGDRFRGGWPIVGLAVGLGCLGLVLTSLVVARHGYSQPSK